MKEKKLYTCEICHTNYADKNSAIECEKYHCVDFTIIGKRYRPKNKIVASIIDRLPVSIRIEDEKGNKVIYKRKDEWTK